MFGPLKFIPLLANVCISCLWIIASGEKIHCTLRLWLSCIITKKFTSANAVITPFWWIANVERHSNGLFCTSHIIRVHHICYCFIYGLFNLSFRIIEVHHVIHIIVNSNLRSITVHDVYCYLILLGLFSLSSRSTKVHDVCHYHIREFLAKHFMSLPYSFDSKSALNILNIR